MIQRWFHNFGIFLIPVVIVLSALSFRAGRSDLLVGTGLLSGTAIAFLIGGSNDGITISSKRVRWYQIVSVGYLFLAAFWVVFLLGVSRSEQYSVVMIVGGLIGVLIFLGMGIDMYFGGKYFKPEFRKNQS